MLRATLEELSARYGGIPAAQFRRLLRLGLGIQGVVVVDRAVCLGFSVGPGTEEDRWERTAAKFTARVVHVKTLGLHTQDRLVAYRALAFSVLGFRAQLRASTPAILRAEAAAQAGVLSMPTHGMPVQLIARLCALDAARGLPSIALAARAAQARVALTHERLLGHWRRLEDLQNPTRRCWGGGFLLGRRALAF